MNKQQRASMKRKLSLKTQNEKILLVEHNDFIKDALQKALEIKGFYVATARTAKEVLRILEQETFDILIGDYELPDGDGLKYFQRIRKTSPGTIKILMTTYGELQTLADIKKYGIHDAIEKPFPFNRLFDIITRQLEDHDHPPGRGRPPGESRP